MKVTFIQTSTHLINGKLDSPLDKYYDNFYQDNESIGYYRPEHFWEIPLWITEASHVLIKYEQELYIIQDIQQAIKDLKNKELCLMSVLEVNKQYYLDIIKALPDVKFVIGGYVNFDSFKELYNVSIMNNMESLHNAFNESCMEYQQETNYELFKGMRTIPRLTLSTGCKHSCKFCTIENELVERTCRNVWEQLDSFIGLDFKLVYINDKTFGQAKNYYWLEHAYNRIRQYNPDFQGFIVQTTALKLRKKSFIGQLVQMHVRIVELGIESYNDSILRPLNKPASEYWIDIAVKNLQDFGIKVIGNIIVGFPDETRVSYYKTLNFIKKSNLFHLNIYNLALYQDTKLANELDTSGQDDNEMQVKKSFMSAEQVDNANWFIQELIK